MGKSPTVTTAKAVKLGKFDPSRVFYRVVIDDHIGSGDAARLKALIEGAKGLKTKYGDLDGIIKAAEGALHKVAK